MTKRFFIMIYSQDGDTAMPMIDVDSELGDVKFFGTEDEAREVGNNHPFASVMGFDIFEMGNAR